MNAPLRSIGFEIIDDIRIQLKIKIKAAIVEVVRQKNKELKANLSSYLSTKLGHDYAYLLNLFSKIKGSISKNTLFVKR